MPDPIKARQFGEEIQKSLALGSHSWEVHAKYEMQYEPWILWNKLAFVLGDDEPTYATAAAHEDKESGGPRTVEVVMFTKDYILHYSGNPDAEEPAISVIPRKSLIGLTVNDAPDISRVPNVDLSKPGCATYSLRFADDTCLSLPLDNVDNLKPEGKASLDSLLEGLKADLITASA